MSARMRAGVGFTIVVALTAFCATGSAQRRRRREPRPTTPMERVARYESARARWHRAVPTPAGFRGSASPTVRLRSIHGGREVALSPLSSGRFSAESLARAESALGDHRNGYRRAIDRRLLDI
ncbi:MAG: hypothetical protein IT379_13325, partial [Deltaproteobacteria bacterium]|nr:hypothetical protein [Deltaproteobacteria bacterium]